MIGNTNGNFFISYVFYLGINVPNIVRYNDHDISMHEYDALGFKIDNVEDAIKPYSKFTTRAECEDEIALTDLLNSIFGPRAKNAMFQLESSG